jgi:hypothetical protein
MRAALRTSVAAAGGDGMGGSDDEDDEFAFDEAVASSTGSVKLQNAELLRARDAEEAERIVKEMRSAEIVPVEAAASVVRRADTGEDVQGLCLKGITLADVSSSSAVVEPDYAAFAMGENGGAEDMSGAEETGALASLRAAYRGGGATASRDPTAAATPKLRPDVRSGTGPMETLAEEEEEEDDDDDDASDASEDDACGRRSSGVAGPGSSPGPDGPLAAVAPRAGQRPSSSIPADVDAHVLRDLSKSASKSPSAASTAPRSAGPASLSAASLPAAAGPQAWTTFEKARAHFAAAGLEVRHGADIVVEDFSKASRAKRIKWGLRGAPSVSYGAEDGDPGRGARERDLVFLVAKVPLLDPETGAMPEPRHRIMQTVYKRLTRTSRDVPRSGSCWISVGFQTGNPATDLRATGMLSMLQALFALEQRPSLMRDAWYLSQDAKQRFPFMTFCINLTLLCMQTLRSGRLSSMANEARDVWGVLNVLYMSLVLSFFRQWEKESCTVMDTDRVLKRLSRAAASKKSIKRIMAEFEAWDARLREAGARPASAGRGAFTDLEKARI